MTFKSLAARAHRLLDRKAVSIHDGTEELQEIEILAATRYRELVRARRTGFYGRDTLIRDESQPNKREHPIGQWAHGDDDAALLCWQGILTAAMRNDGLSATKPKGKNLTLRVGSMRPQAWRRRAEQTLAALRLLARVEGKAPAPSAGTTKPAPGKPRKRARKALTERNESVYRAIQIKKAKDYKTIASMFGITPGRVAQIKKQVESHPDFDKIFGSGSSRQSVNPRRARPLDE